MRLSPIAPAGLTPEQRRLYDDMQDGIAEGFKGFVAIRDDGALLGPWNPWLHEPSFGKASWDLVRAPAEIGNGREEECSGCGCVARAGSGPCRGILRSGLASNRDVSRFIGRSPRAVEALSVLA
jgi:hypothetical protein